MHGQGWDTPHTLEKEKVSHMRRCSKSQLPREWADSAALRTGVWPSRGGADAVFFPGCVADSRT